RGRSRGGGAGPDVLGARRPRGRGAAAGASGALDGDRLAVRCRHGPGGAGVRPAVPDFAFPVRRTAAAGQDPAGDGGVVRPGRVLPGGGRHDAHAHRAGAPVAAPAAQLDRGRGRRHVAGGGQDLMELVLALAIGVLTASGVWLLLRPRTFQVIIGLTLISYAVNLFIFSTGGLRTGADPVLREIAGNIVQ